MVPSMSVRPPNGVYESILYAEDLEAATAFYRDILGLRLVDQIEDLATAFRLSDSAMLLIFDPHSSSAPNRPAPSHGANGPGHIAFRIDAAEFEGWRARLADHDVAIEKEHEDGATQQLYFRDPAGNSVELVRGELWPA